MPDLFTALAGVLYGVLLVTLGANMVYLRRTRRLPAVEAWPRLSVLVPARNEAENLQRLVPALLGQTYPDFEVVLYDDASEDDTAGVLHAYAGDSRLRVLRGTGPPPGWLGKVHALYQATRQATGACYLFIDADVELKHPDALRHLVARYQALPTPSVASGLPHMRGGGLPLVSLVPNAILGSLPWPLVRRLRRPSMGMVNGPCWLIDRDLYHVHEPHEAVKAEILEDVEIGRYLLRQGVVPVLLDAQDDVAVQLYDGLADAWRGYQKNAYLLVGGTPLAFAALHAYHLVLFVVAPWTSVWLMAALYLWKGGTDRLGRQPAWVTLLTPLIFVLSAVLQLDSAWRHATGRVAWKGRPVATASTSRAPVS
ncbi:MAG: glycosyltransferase family 2 protein [Bacteroidota bacterium]